MTTTTALDATTSFLLERVGLTDKIAETAAELVRLADEHQALDSDGVDLRRPAVVRTRAGLRQARLVERLEDLVRDLPETDEGPFRIAMRRGVAGATDAVVLVASDGEVDLAGSSRR